MNALRRRLPTGYLSQPWALALLLAVAAAVVVGSALLLESFGYAPCELCLRERIPYYIGVPVALVTALAARRGRHGIALAGFAVLLLTFAAGTALGLYHAGVEWHFWPGPSECSGAVTAPPDVADFLKQLNHVAVVRCDQAALTVLGLSLAGWSALISAGFVALANVGILRTGALRGSGGTGSV